MDRQGHDYMGYNQPNNIPPPQQQHQTSNIPPPQHQQQPFNFHPQQQFPPPGPHGAHGPHGPPFIPQHPYQYLPPQYPHAPPPHFHHLRPPPPANFPPPPHLPFPPPPAPPPSDLELQKRIDKLIEYSFKNGPEFEAMIREKQKDNPEYSFLFLGEGHNYYRYKLWLITTQPPQSGPHFNHPPFHQPMVGPPIFHNTQFRPPFKGLSKPLPSDIEMEFNNVLNTLTGTKESIKGAKNWFMQRSPFIPALAEALRDRVFLLEDSERQLHIIYLVNDILFESLQRRINPHELDNEAIAFKPVLGSMLARVYHNPQNKEENQSKLLKIVQFWASKEVYDQETVRALEHEMINSFQSFRNILPDSGLPHQHAPPPIWQQQPNILPNIPDQDKQFHPSTIPPTIFPVSSLQPPPQPPLATATSGEKPPPYPLFPPGLIPGMVRKMQIGSGVPYSPLSPLDIPTIIPPSTISSSEILDSVSKFFKEIGEVNPSVGPTKDEYDDNDDYESERKGGACIPPPSDGEYGGTGSGRLGLGASGSESNESTQYDDVYSSYRKQRSSTYHVSMSARTGAR